MGSNEEIQRLGSMPEWARTKLVQYADPQKFELLLPSIPVDAVLGYGYQPSVSIVRIDPDPKGGEIFNVGVRYEGSGADKQEVKLFAYAKPGLLKLASAAGIQMKTERVDGRTNQDYCEVRAIGLMRTETGQPMLRTATKAFYMPDVSAEAWQSRTKRNASKPEKWRQSEVDLKAAHDGEMLAFRKHLLRRTEAGAITAVIRELLGVKSQQTLAQIAKPKVLIRVDFRPDHNDPTVKRFLLEQAAASALSLYGAAPRSGAEVVAEAVVQEIPPDEETQAARLAASAQPAAEAKHEPTEEETIAEIEQGCDILGLNLIQRNDLFTTHKGDLAAMLRDLNERVTKMQAGEN